MHRTIGPVVALILGMSFFVGGRASADCPPVETWPAFNDIAEEARRVVVGTVAETGSGLVSEFHVDEILRGRARRVIDLTRLSTYVSDGAGGCAFDGLIEVRVGDRLAVAFNGTIDGWDGTLDSVALIDAPEDHPNLSNLERLSIEQARLLLGHESNGTTVAAPKGADRGPDLLTSLLRSLTGGFFDLEAEDSGWDLSDTSE